MIRKFLLPVLIAFYSLALTSCENKQTVIPNKVHSISDLGHKKVGVQIGNTADIYASEYGGDTAKIDVERYTKLADAVQALMQGKVDAVMSDDQPAKAFVRQNPSLRILEEVFVEEMYAGVVAKGNEALLDSVNQAIAQMKFDGVYDSIFNNYINHTSDYHYQKKVTEGPKLILSTNAQFPPYEFYKDNKIVGLDIEIVNYIADYLHRTVEIQDIEFDAIINAVASGKADVGFAGFTVTEERKKSINFTTPYTLSKVVVIVRGDKAIESEESLGDHFYKNFVKESRWKFIVEGLRNTLVISFFAALLGILIGFVVAQIRTSNEFNGRWKVLNWFAKAYLAVIRGTPMMIQLLIIYYIVFSSVNVNKILVAIVAFGVNSGAYVSEIIRSGIKGVDPGQIEAGRSLGLKFRTILYHIVYPQAFKNSLPALTNEFISLIKETSICGYIGLTDLTRGGDIIRSQTYDAFLPLTAVALTYLTVVMLFTWLLGILERNLKKNER